MSSAIDPDEFDAERFYDEFQEEHSGHVLEDGNTSYKTVRYTGTHNAPTVATAHCPLCEVEEEVIYHRRICPHHQFGKHIKVRCKECGETGTTKNIKYIGARTVFVGCDCDWNIEHVCDAQED